MKALVSTLALVGGAASAVAAPTALALIVGAASTTADQSGSTPAAPPAASYTPVDTIVPPTFPNSGRRIIVTPADNLNTPLSAAQEGDTLVLQGTFSSALKFYGTGNGGKLAHDINVDATGATLAGATITGGLTGGAPIAVNWLGGVFQSGSTLLLEGQSASAAMPSQIHNVQCRFTNANGGLCISLQKASYVLVYDNDIQDDAGDGIDCGSCTFTEVWHNREFGGTAGTSHPDFFQAWEIAGSDHIHDLNIHDNSITGLTQGIDDFDGAQPKSNIAIRRNAYSGPAQWAAGSWGNCTNCTMTNNEAFADIYPEPWEYGGPWQSGFYMSGTNVTSTGNVAGAKPPQNSSNTNVSASASVVAAPTMASASQTDITQ